jgi:outer membrane lipoprotein-sorting protein
MTSALPPPRRGMLFPALLISGLVLASQTASAAPPTSAEVTDIVKSIDGRQHNSGDWRSLVYIEQKQGQSVDVAYEAMIYRRSEDQRLVILLTKPKASQGQGYLRIDQNLWFYDPTVGKWERRTESERIGGTNSRRSDFDESRLAQDYDAEFVGEEKVGSANTISLKLSGKQGRDLAFPVIKLWVDRETRNVLKRQEFALSGKLLRTSYFPKWTKLYSESKKGDVWFPQEVRMLDEVEKSNQTTVVVRSVDLKPVERNLFTKAWLESKSR